MNPRQGAFAKERSFKDANGGPKVPKQAEAKEDGVINPKIYNFYWINTENVDALQTLRINQYL